MKRVGYKLFGAVALFVAAASLVWILMPKGNVASTRVDWRSEWAAAPGFAVSIDTKDYEYPTSIAFVPDPGEGPKDALYFVTELKGRVKVVTNDRSVYTFAENFYEIQPV